MIYRKYSHTSPNAIFWPLIISVPKGVMYDELYDICRSHCNPFIDDKEEKIYLTGDHNAGISGSTFIVVLLIH